MQALWELDRAVFQAIHEGLRGDLTKAIFGIISMSGVGHVHIAPLLMVWARARESTVFFWSTAALLSVAVGFLGDLDEVALVQLAAFAILTFCCRGLSIDIAKRAILAFLVSGLFHLLMKAVIPRERPSNFDWAIPLENVYSTRSFPSGHTSTAFAIGLTLFLLLDDRRWAWTALIWGILVGISRVAVGVHFPSDVLGGYGVGAIGAGIAILISEAMSKKKKQLELTEVA